MIERFSDETLTAYLDGELDAQARNAVETAIENDAEIAARLEALALPVTELKGAFDTLLPTAPAMPQIAEPAAPRSSRVGWGIAAAFLFGLVLGGGWSLMPQPEAPVGWRQAVANYQLLYVPETLASVAADPETAARNLSQVSAVLGRDLSAAQNASGLEFKRAQVLGLNGKPLIQIAYLSDRDEPFAICVISSSKEDYAPTAEVISGLAAAHWVSNGFGYLVIGGQDLGVVQGLAQEMSTEI